MSTRTCQLCGKPLSRLWVGGGDDFCSREHRNQYRLRRGMDRLQEANKVSSLMRRREHPKAIALASHEGYVAARPAEAPVIRLSGWRVAPKLPALKHEMQAGMLCNRTGQTVRAIPAGTAQRREFEAPRLRIQTSAPLMPSRSIRPADSGGVQNGRGPQPLHIGAKTGKPLRVSAAAAFRLPAKPLMHIPAPQQRTAVLEWPQDVHNSVIQGSPAAPRAEEKPAVFAISEPLSRGLMARGSAVGFPLPGVRRFSTSRVRDAAIQSRLSGVNWDLPDRTGLRPLRQPSPGLPPAGLTPIARTPGAGEAGPRLAAAPFVPPDTPFGYPGATPPEPEEPAESPAGAPPAAVASLPAPPVAVPAPAPAPVSVVRAVPPPAPPAPVAPAAPPAEVKTTPHPVEQPASLAPVDEPPPVEENFRDGWENDWIGGVDDWPQDLPGVRTGSLAFFAATLDMEDYDLEFHTRVENRSVTWAFRAANFRDYHLATISIAPGGGYEFTRATVRAGSRIPASALPLPLPLRGNKSFTVRLRAMGNDFTVWVEGKRLTTWTDSRLPAGGIGFMGAPDDRARIYWIRLFQPRSLDKENPKV